MLNKLIKILRSSYGFWKSFILNGDKKSFLIQNREILKTQAIVLLSAILVTFIVYKSLNPAVKGVCQIVLSSNDGSADTERDRLVGIEAAKAKKGTTLREVKSIGTLKANAEVVIRSEIPGKIKEILFAEGTNVKKGDELIKFEDDLYISEKNKSEAEYILRKSEFERVEKLYQQKVGSRKTYDEALAQMNAAKAQLDSATFQLSRTVIKAPFDGTIGIMKGSVSPGNIVQQQTELVDIVDNSMVRVEFLVPVKYIEDIAVGQNVEITVDAFKDKVFSGTVDAIDSEVDTRNHSILVRAVIPNRNGNLKHGMFANVKLITGEKNDVILIDEDALDREGAIEFVWVVDEKGRAYRKRVLVGAKDVNGAEIVAGLADGEIVVTTGQLKLTEGALVKILNKDDFAEETEKAPQKDEIVDEDEAKSSNASSKTKSSVLNKVKNFFKKKQNTDDKSDVDDKKEAESNNASSKSRSSVLNKVKNFFKKKKDTDDKSDAGNKKEVSK